MSGVISGIFGGGANSWFQPHPTERILQEAARVHHQEDPVVQPPIAYTPHADAAPMSKVKKVTVVAGTVLTAAELGHQAYQSPVVNNVVTPVREFVKNTASTTAETIKEKAGSFFGSLGWSTVGLGFMSYLPYSVQYLVGGTAVVALGFGISGAIGLYRSCRYPNGYSSGGSNTIHSNVNVHLNLPGLPSNCKPVVNTHNHADGSKDVHVGVQCEAPLAPVVSKQELASAYAKRAPVRAANKLTYAKECHEKLNELNEAILDARSPLSDALKVNIKQLTERYNELEKRKYVDSSLTSLLAQAGSLIDQAQNELRARGYHQQLTEIFKNNLKILSNYGDHHLKDDIVSLKTRFDGFEKKHFDVRNLNRHLDAAAITLAAAEKEIIEYQRTVALRMRTKRKINNE